MTTNLIYSDFTDNSLPIDLTYGIILQRNEKQEVSTNVPHHVTHHSPSGFEFGYGGSGPADLALNILEEFLQRLGFEGEKTQCWRGECLSLAFELHQEFKWKFISPAPRKGVNIPFEDAMGWLLDHMTDEQVLKTVGG